MDLQISSQTIPTTSLDWLAAFSDSLLQRGCSKNTVQAYVRDLRHFADWFAGANGGQAFTPELINGWDLRQYRAWELEICQVAPKTWNRRRASLSAFCQWLTRTQRIELHFHFDEIPPQAEEETPPDWLTDREFNALMRYVENAANQANTQQRKTRAIRDWAITAVMVYAGLRDQEVCDLTIGDISLSERRGRLIVRRGKGEKHREVPLNAEARRALSAWLVERGSDAPGEPLFISDDGAAVSTRAVEKRFTKIGLSCHIEGLHPHRLRHTCTKRMIDAGRPLTEAQKILGHARLETTARYAQAGWEDLEAAVEAGTLGRLAHH